MSNSIGAETRREQIIKWKVAVTKYTDLLLAFTYKEIKSDAVARFRAHVATRIVSLAKYLADGEWGLFDGTPLEPPLEYHVENAAELLDESGRTKAEVDAELAERAAGEDASAAMEAERDAGELNGEQTNEVNAEQDAPRKGGKRKGGKK